MRQISARARAEEEAHFAEANPGDRSDFFLDKSFPDDYFIQTYDIAVRLGEQWRFYDPASTYVPHGMLRWQE